MAADREALRRLFPFENRYLDVGGARMHYLDEGKGEPLLCLHGNPTWSFHFRELAKALRDSRRLIVPDHVGCGYSEKPPDAEYEYVLDRRVRDVEALLDHLGLDRGLTLVAHDWGGMIGMAVASRRPQAFRRFVLFNTAAFLPPAGKRLPLRLWIVRNLGPLAALLVRGFNGFAAGAARTASEKGLAPEVRAAYLAPYDSWRNRIATLRFVQDIPLRPGDRSYDLVRSVEERLGGLRGVPMLILWGARDFVFDADYLAEWRRRFPAAQVHVFEDAGHYVLEDALDRILPLVRDFLARNPPG